MFENKQFTWAFWIIVYAADYGADFFYFIFLLLWMKSMSVKRTFRDLLDNTQWWFVNDKRHYCFGFYFLFLFYLSLYIGVVTYRKKMFMSIFYYLCDGAVASFSGKHGLLMWQGGFKELSKCDFSASKFYLFRNGLKWSRVTWKRVL